MSYEPLLSSPERTDLGLVEDLFASFTRRFKTRLIRRCGGDVALRAQKPRVRPLKDVLGDNDGFVVGAAAPFSLQPGSVRGLILFDASLVSRLVGLFLGESRDHGAGLSQRSFTRTDLQLVGRVFSDTLVSLVESCSLSDKPKGSLGPTSPNARSVRSLPSSTHCIEVELEMGPEEAPYGVASIVLPPQAAGVLWPDRDGATKAKPRVENGMARVLPLNVPVVAEMMRRSIPMRDLKGYQVGDVLELGSLADVQVKVGGQTALIGEAGDAGGVRCVRVVRRTAAAEDISV